MADIRARAASNFGGLLNEERVRCISLVACTCQIWEALHRQYLRGQLDDDLRRSHVKMLQDVQALDGFKRA